ncbi:MAG TPA: hypothetical protein PK461_16675 [Alcaligenes faecalis]|nr:hypothetical protein [Alcaligenes faecalis]
MTSTPGAIDTFKTPEGKDVPFYILKFNKNGVLESPQTKQELVRVANEFTDIYFFSHGWNNDWTWANTRYRAFFKEYSEMRRKQNLSMPDSYKPLLIGVFWPSTALVFGEDERGPVIKRHAPDDSEDVIAQTQFKEDLDEVASMFNEQDKAELYALVQGASLSLEEAQRLAQLASKLPLDPEVEEVVGGQADSQEILQAWIEDSKDNKEPGRGGVHVMGVAPQADKAGTASWLDPRRIIRLLTVAIMKDRAGVVGYRGVGPVLQDLLDHSAARIHLIGHSYGAKVMLSALSATRSDSRKVHCALLLQPAISHLAFASRIPGRNWAGGYHAQLARVDRPIFSTFSRHDVALHKVFHWALRRQKDLGEYAIKALQAPDPVPSVYAALGGYGPRASGERLMPLQSPGSPYSLDADTRIYGLDGTADQKIAGHGDVVSPHTAWALYTLIQYPGSA